ncbi:ABC transporter ATP-binding protein [Polymorphobacter sp.]|uniref:ABC transporter ATP-binding protein n=1 Tax=Polymorphobacter sp. TaxID=1909290 RepID=UPI003F6F572A
MSAAAVADPAGLTVTIAQDGPIPLNLSLTCAPGELLALVGPSGAGKTSLLRAVAGLHRPAAGQIHCAGEPWFDSAIGIDRPPHRRRVGLVFQSYALFPHMTALANIEAALGDTPAAQRRDRAHALLALVHLAGLENRRPAELSGGQQQRVALARALARDPQVLLLDEPFSAVDRRTRRALREELASLRATLTIPILLVTHDLDEAAAMADTLAVLYHGRLLQQGPPAEVLATPASPQVRAALDLP